MREQYPNDFSDAQFPNIGYTYIINLGTPIVMQIGDKKFPLEADGFLPRYNAIECFHKHGNHFLYQVSYIPIALEKKIDFSEYRGYIFLLSYRLVQTIIDKVKKAGSFEERISVLSKYFLSLLAGYEGSLHQVNIVSEILEHCVQKNQFTVSIETLAAQNNISFRTLQRYFEMCTCISSQQALQVMRIRKATSHLANSPQDFHYSIYNYYDHSHFYKHLKHFLQESTLKNLQPHLKLLEGLHKQVLLAVLFFRN